MTMNTSKEMMKAARAKALMSGTLRKALKDWFGRRGDRTYPEINDFNEWVEKEIDFLALMLHEEKNVTVDNLVSALHVEAIGDKNAVKFANAAAAKGWRTDVECYVEEGVVHASLWISGKDAKATEKMADEIADKFRGMGYATDIWIDEEDDRDVTVNACVDFPVYADIVR